MLTVSRQKNFSVSFIHTQPSHAHCTNAHSAATHSLAFWVTTSFLPQISLVLSLNYNEITAFTAWNVTALVKYSKFFEEETIWLSRSILKGRSCRTTQQHKVSDTTMKTFQALCLKDQPGVQASQTQLSWRCTGENPNCLDKGQDSKKISLLISEVIKSHERGFSEVLKFFLQTRGTINWVVILERNLHLPCSIRQYYASSGWGLLTSLNISVVKAKVKLI